MNTTPQTPSKKKADVSLRAPAQSACCAVTASDVSSCGCEEGKPVATVVNDQGNTVSACCGKPVTADRQSGTCCG